MDPITITGVSVAWLIIFIITLVSIVRNPNRGFGGKVLWILIAFFLGLIGSILWLLLGRGRVAK